MEDYRLPQVTLPLPVITKACTAVGIFFVCPVCQKEIFFPDERLATGIRDCPTCHTPLDVPYGEDRVRLIKRSVGVFMP